MRERKMKITAWLLTAVLILCMVPTYAFASDYEKHWAATAIAKWSDLGIVKGYEDGTFRPSKQVTRAELAAFIVRVFGLTDTSNAKHFEDVKSDKWYASDVAKISSADIMFTSTSKFMPNTPATREDAAYAVAKAYKVTGKSSNAFKDDQSISIWAKEAVDALYAKGYVSGQGADKFGPKAALTRADIIAMLDKITGKLIHQAGTYTEDVKGNLVVNTRDVVLKNMTIKGNLYLAPGIGDGDVTLEGITVEGKTFVEGGGINSIKSRDSKFYEAFRVSANNPVRIVIEGEGIKVEAMPGTKVTLTGSFKEVIVTENVTMTVKDAIVENIIVQPPLTSGQNVKIPVIEIAAGSTVKQIQADSAVTTTGTGKVENLIVNADGVKLQQQPASTIIKNDVIKVEIAGVQQTQETVKAPSTTTTSGGGGGSAPSTPNTPSTPSTPPTKCQVTGVVTYNKVPVQFASMNIWKKDNTSSSFHLHTETNVEGAYSFYVPSGTGYHIEAWIVDEDGYGYHASSENITISSNPTTINIELVKRHVANVIVTDKNSIPVHHAKIVEVKDGKEINWWHTDSKGFACIFLWEQNKEYTYKIYVDQVEVADLTGVKQTDNYKAMHLVSIPQGLSNTLSGKAVLEDGTPAAGMSVRLEALNEEKTTTRHYYWDLEDITLTDADGNYSFSGINPSTRYSVSVWDYRSNGVYISEGINALIADQVSLQAKRAYIVDVAVHDKNNAPITNANVRILDESGSRHESRTDLSGLTKIFYPGMKPGHYILEVTAGSEVIVHPFVIAAGTYSYNHTIKFDNVTADITKPVFIASVTGELHIAGNQLKPAQVIITDGKEGRVEQIRNGKAYISIPPNLHYRIVNVLVTSEDGTILYQDDQVRMDGNKVEWSVDLSALPVHTVGKMKPVLITTDGAINLVDTEDVYFSLYKKDSEGFDSLIAEDLKDSFTLSEGTYMFTAAYTSQSGQRYNGAKTVPINGDNPEIDIALNPVVSMTVQAQDETGTPLKNISFEISTTKGYKRYRIDDGGVIVFDTWAYDLIDIRLCGTDFYDYTLTGVEGLTLDFFNYRVEDHDVSIILKLSKK